MRKRRVVGGKRIRETEKVRNEVKKENNKRKGRNVKMSRSRIVCMHRHKRG